MADGDRRNSSREKDANCIEEESAEELMQTLLELNNSVCNISKLIQQLQKNIAKDTAQQIDAIAARTLH